MNHRLLATVASFLLLVTGTTIAIRYAQGYRLSRTTVVKSTGLLSANSFPNGASVYINGALTTATDSTVNLSPGEYEIEIRKEGYFPWKKKLLLETELVTQTNAMLFPTAPGLTPLTFMGAQNVQPSPDGERLLFTTASASAQRNNGLYVIDLGDNPLTLQKGPRQLARNLSNIDLTEAQFLWSPDADQILITSGTRHYLIDAGRFTDLETARDVSLSVEDTLEQWKQVVDQRRLTLLQKFPREIQAVATESGTPFFVSADQERIMYVAGVRRELSAQLATPVPASNSQPQSRALEPGNVYVYDRREDRNFLFRTGSLSAPTPTPKPAKTASPATAVETRETLKKKLSEVYSPLVKELPQWLPDSKHLISLTTSGIQISEYDATNATQVYSGPLSEKFVFPWPNGSKLIILANFNQTANSPLNLYSLSLR